MDVAISHYEYSRFIKKVVDGRCMGAAMGAYEAATANALRMTTDKFQDVLFLTFWCAALEADAWSQSGPPVVPAWWTTWDEARRPNRPWYGHCEVAPDVFVCG